MSLLADLLSKVTSARPDSHRVDAPPGLKRTVAASAGKEAARKKIVIISALAALMVAAGIASTYLAEIYLKPMLAARKGEEGAERRRIAKQAVADKQVAAKEPPAVSQEKPPAPVEQAKITAQAIRPVEEKKPETGRKPVKEKKRRASTEKARKAEGMGRADVKPPEKAGNGGSDAGPEKTGKKDAPGRDLYLYMAGTSESKKDYAGAIANYKGVLEADPDNYIVLNNIANVLIHIGSFEEAIEYSKKALAIKKDHVASLVNLGIAFMKLDNFAEGETCLSKAVSIEPSNKYAVFNIALLYEKTGDYIRADAYFQALSRMGDMQGYLGLGRIAEKDGRTAEAVRIYKGILSMSGIDPQIKVVANERIVALERL